MGLTKKQIKDINNQALNLNKKPLNRPENKKALNFINEEAQLNQPQVEPLALSNPMLDGYNQFKEISNPLTNPFSQKPMFNDVERFELQKNNTYKSLMQQADKLKFDADNSIAQATAYRGIHKDLNGNDVEIKSISDYVSYLKNNNDPKGDDVKFIENLYNTENNALKLAAENKRRAAEIENLANEKIQLESERNIASADDLKEYRDRVNAKYTSLPGNSTERNELARDWRKDYQDITNFKVQEQMWNNVPQDLRNNIQNAVTNNDTDTATKLLKEAGYTDNDISSIVSKAERNRDYEIAKKEKAQTEKFANEHPVLATVDAIGNALNPIDDIGAVGELLKYRMNQSIRNDESFPAEAFNQYNEAQRNVNKKLYERETVANNIDNPLLKSAYNIGNSIVDNTARMAEAAAVDKAVPGAGRVLNGLLASLDVASSTIKEGEDRGLNTAQIASTALADAINEQLFETLSFDKVVDTEIVLDNAKSFLKSVAKSAGIEGSEEVFTDVANEAADRVLNADQAEMNQNYKKLLETGYSEKEANKIIWKEKAQQLAESFIAGAISGGVMSGTMAGVNTLTNKVANKAVENKVLKSAGNEIIKSGNVSRIQNYVNNMNLEDEETQNIVNNTNWEKPAEVGRAVAQLIQNENNKANNAYTQQLETAITNRLENEGVTSPGPVAKMIISGQDISGLNNDAVNKAEAEFNLFKEGTIDNTNKYFNKLDLSEADTHLRNASTLAELTRTDIERNNGGNIQENTQKAENEQNTRSQGIIGNNEKSYVLKNPNQKFEILTLAADKEGNTKVVAKGSHELFNPDQVALDKTTAQLVEASNEFNKEKKQIYFKGAESGIDNVANYTVAFNKAYEIGAKGLGLSTAINDANINMDLNREQIEEIYNAGLKEYVKEAQQKHKMRLKSTNKYSGEVDMSNIDTTKLNDTQKGAIDFMSAIAKNVGVDIELFESSTDKNGRYVGENGSYNPNTNNIRIDINAGLRVEGEKRNTMVITLAHELTHSFEFNAPETYAQLQEYVFDKLAKTSGKSTEELVIEEAAKLKQQDTYTQLQNYVLDKLSKNGNVEDIANKSGISVKELVNKEISKLNKQDIDKIVSLKTDAKYEEIAKSELVARSCESLLTDEQAIKELAYTNKGLFGKIKEWIEQLCDSLKKAYADLFENGKLKAGIVSAEAEALKDFENHIRTIWNNAVIETQETTEKVAVEKKSTGKDNNVSTKKSDKTDKKSESSKNFENAKKNFEKRYEDIYNAINDIYAEYLNKDEEAAKRAGLETLDLLNYYTKISPEQAMNDADFSVDGFKNIYKGS